MADLMSWQQCRALCGRVLDALDWAALGQLYFHEDGERELRRRRDRILECGEAWARALLRRLPAGGTSLHVGAGLSELPVMIAEVCVRGRSVRAANLRRRECELIGSALRRHGLGKRLAIEPVDGGVASDEGGYDHLGCVSLFTDPETFALLSDVTYGRVAPVQIDVERFVAEREEARTLASRLFDGLRSPGWITTTADEAAWFLEAAARRELPIEADEELLPTALVGDPIGFLRVGAGP